MNRLKRIILSLSMLALFVSYQAGLTLFTHVHYINGVAVVHSHPGKAGHTHTGASIHTISCLSLVQSLGASDIFHVHLFRTVVGVVPVPHELSDVMAESSEALCLRAPPVA